MLVNERYEPQVNILQQRSAVRSVYNHSVFQMLVSSDSEAVDVENGVNIEMLVATVSSNGAAAGRHSKLSTAPMAALEPRQNEDSSQNDYG